MQGLQEQKPAFVVFRIPKIDTLTRGINIAHLKRQALAEAQTETVQRDKEHPVAYRAGRHKQTLRLFNHDDIRQATVLFSALTASLNYKI
ncbi:MAG: hypothetical protein IBX56_16200 [Methylomicrobium sp.]|nr:hypothetical protein [Methylomicrobium sp.]